MSSRDAVTYARSDFQKGCSASEVAEKLAQLAIKRHTAGARDLRYAWCECLAVRWPGINFLSLIAIVTYKSSSSCAGQLEKPCNGIHMFSGLLQIMSQLWSSIWVAAKMAGQKARARARGAAA